MRTNKRWLAILLSVMMVVSVLPLNLLAAEEVSVEALPQVEEGPVNLSLLPLKEVYVEADLSCYFFEELAAVTPAMLLAEYDIPESAKVVWRLAHYGGDYTVINADEPLGLNDYLGYHSRTFEMIVGTAEQLDAANVRYIIDVTLPYFTDWFRASAQTADADRTEIDVLGLEGGNGTTWDDNGDPHFYYLMRFVLDGMKYSDIGHMYVKLELGEDYQDKGVSFRFYEGRYFDLETLEAAAPVEITDQLYGTSATGYQIQFDERTQFVTAVVQRGETESVILFGLYIEPQGILSGHSHLYGYNRNGVWVDCTAGYYSLGYDLVYTVDAGFLADDVYNFNLVLFGPNLNYKDYGTCGIDLVDSAYVGSYTSKTEAEDDGAENIKAELFSSAEEGFGYRADFSKGVAFTVFDVEGGIWHYTVKANEYQGDGMLNEGGPMEADTFFQANGADDEEGNYLPSYLVSHESDGYYYNGYHTVFLLDNNGDPIEEESVIKPTFYSGSRVKVYRGENGTGGKVQKSGHSKIDFHSGEPLSYSAASEDGTHLKNYWVTFLTRQSGAKLFVNAATNSVHRDEESDLPIRTVFLNDYYGNKHDVMFANIGDVPLEGLTVTLTDAVNIQLDPYWTIGDAGTLAPFTTTESIQIGTEGETSNFGELPNIGKIRLIPTGNDGEISGTLTISSANGGSETIKLTGIAGLPHIITDNVEDGVKYVPYSSLLQTDNLYDDDLVQFVVTDGELPNGVEIKPNGEIYGVPTESGTFTFTVKAVCGGNIESAEGAEYTMTIAENTNLNVLESTDSGYDVTEFVGVEQDEAGEFLLEKAQEEVFWTDGSYGYFLDFWLDGEKLVEGEDYESEEGSTKITIYAQTFKNAGKGTHTIAAEFREGDPVDGTLKRAAQNYTLNSVGKNNNTSIAPSNPTESEKPVEPGEPEVTPPTGDQDFVDVYVSDWFYGDVNWAAEQQLMVGIADRIFAPYEQISLAMVVTTLARMSEEDLAPYADLQYEDILPDEWYSDAAAWAKYNELLGTEPFTAMPPLARGRLAVVLVNYLAYKGIDTTVPFDAVTFADADQMSREELDAFKVLYHFGIFNGVGNNCMNPAGATTRAELAALLHRLSVFVERF